MAAACVQAIWTASAPSISSFGATASIIARAAFRPRSDGTPLGNRAADSSWASEAFTKSLDLVPRAFFSEAPVNYPTYPLPLRSVLFYTVKRKRQEHIYKWRAHQSPRYIRIPRARSDMPIMYLSGNAGDRERCVAGSVFFQKPYQATTILSACQNFGNIARRQAVPSGLPAG